MSSYAALYKAEVPDAYRSLMLSVMSVAFFAGLTGGNAAMGFVAERVSLTAGWVGLGLLVVLNSGILLRLQTDIQEREESAM